MRPLPSRLLTVDAAIPVSNIATDRLGMIFLNKVDALADIDRFIVGHSFLQEGYGFRWIERPRADVFSKSSFEKKSA